MKSDNQTEQPASVVAAITIKVGAKTIELTEAEARFIHSELTRLFGVWPIYTASSPAAQWPYVPCITKMHSYT